MSRQCFSFPVPTGLGQLLVWEWQSESYILKQQGHFNSMVSLAYSPDGQYIVTGGDDGKVGTGLLWAELWVSQVGGLDFSVFNSPNGPLKDANHLVDFEWRESEYPCF